MAGSKSSLTPLNTPGFRQLLSFWLGIALVRLFAASQLGLAADEAYY